VHACEKCTVLQYLTPAKSNHNLDTLLTYQSVCSNICFSCFHV